MALNGLQRVQQSQEVNRWDRIGLQLSSHHSPPILTQSSSADMFSLQLLLLHESHWSKACKFAQKHQYIKTQLRIFSFLVSFVWKILIPDIFVVRHFSSAPKCLLVSKTVLGDHFCHKFKRYISVHYALRGWDFSGEQFNEPQEFTN